MELQGARVLVVGASSGIGRGIALELSSTLRVIATYGGRQDAARSLQQETGAEIFQLDIASAGDRQALLAFCKEKYGRLDLLVNNAGMAPRVRADILEATEDSFAELVRSNVQGPYFLTQLVARHLLERKSADVACRGAIVFITSVSAEAASTNRGDYCVSKAGLSMAARLFALRLAAAAIPVYEVRPGIIETDMTAKVRDVYDRRIADGLVPEGRWGQAADVGRTVAALLRGDLPYATGSVVHVDGGLSIPRL